MQMIAWGRYHIDGLEQERRNSSMVALGNGAMSFLH